MERELNGFDIAELFLLNELFFFHIKIFYVDKLILLRNIWT